MGCPAATRVDKIPIVNTPKFGVCAVSGSPCVPAPIEWLDTYKSKVKGEETLLYRCTLPCGVGGIIDFITSGQIPIERIKTGNRVWAFDKNSGAIEFKEVLQTVECECNHTIELYTAQKTIRRPPSIRFTRPKDGRTRQI